MAFEVATNPTTLKGQITLSAGPSVAGKTAFSVDGSVTAVLADPWIVEVDGDAKLAQKLELGSAFVRFSSAGLFEFGGKAQWELSIVKIEGAVAGWIAGLHNFDVEGSVNGCVSLYIYTPCAGAKALVSNLGIAACVEVLGEGVGVERIGVKTSTPSPAVTSVRGAPSNRPPKPPRPSSISRSPPGFHRWRGRSTGRRARRPT